MMALRLVWALVLVGCFAITACGGDGDCGEDEVEVTYIGTSDDRTECKPIPAECGGVANCAVMACISAMYGLCEDLTFGVGCSDTFAPTIISCNE